MAKKTTSTAAARKPAAKKTAAKKTAVAHPALHGIAQRVRSGNNGPGKQCGKHKLFALYVAGKLPTGAALERFAKENHVKPSTCGSWVSNWDHGLIDSKHGSYIPPQANDASVLKAYKKQQKKA